MNAGLIPTLGEHGRCKPSRSHHQMRSRELGTSVVDLLSAQPGGANLLNPAPQHMTRGRKPRKVHKVEDGFPKWMCPTLPPALRDLPGREPHVLYDEPDEVELEVKKKLRTYSTRRKSLITKEV